jgi:hypothetical protein
MNEQEVGKCDRQQGVLGSEEKRSGRSNMIHSITGIGFLSTHAPLSADVSWNLMLISMALLIVGRQLRMRRRDHSNCAGQTAAVILNTMVVAVVIIALF